MLSVVTAGCYGATRTCPRRSAFWDPARDLVLVSLVQLERRIMRQGVLPALGSRETSEPSHSEDGPVPVSVSPRPRRGT